MCSAILHGMEKDYYCIAGNFGEVCNLANWQFCGKLPNLKPADIIFVPHRSMQKGLQSPNLNSLMHSDD